jgi:hypothetical protein
MKGYRVTGQIGYWWFIERVDRNQAYSAGATSKAMADRICRLLNIPTVTRTATTARHAKRAVATVGAQRTKPTRKLATA